MGKVVGFYTDERGRVRPITARRGRRRGTIFFPAKYKYAAEHISLRSPEEARASAKWLMEEFNRAETRDKKVRIKRFAVLAYNRAKAGAGNPRLSARERREYAQIAQIYKEAYEGMKL